MQSSLLPLRQRVAPILTLLLLAPVIAEILEGSTHLTNLFVFPAQVGVYGCAALLIRTLVRSERKAWIALLLLGIAYGLTEECVILQTSLTPLFAAKVVYGRFLDVNWIYLLWAVGYESVWSIILPIQLTELIFPRRRDDPWMGKVGLIITAIVFVLASFYAWHLWMSALSKFSHGQQYQPPLLTIAVAVIVIIALVVVALILPASSRIGRVSNRKAPHPWLVGTVAFILGLFWFVSLLFHYGIFPTFPFALAFALFLAWALGALWLIGYGTTTRGWGDRQRLALIFGALLASMLAGFLLAGITLPIDFIWKGVCDVLALLGLAYLAWNVRHRVNEQANEPTQEA